MRLPQYLLELIHEIQKLPSIGNKSATRLALFFLQNKDSNAVALANQLVKSKKEMRICSLCKSLSDSEICSVCSDSKRDFSKICIVEQVVDVITIEKAGFYNGLYHVLGGVVSPLEGVYEKDLNLDSFYSRLKNRISEVIYSIPSGIESDTTFLIIKEFTTKNYPELKLSRMAVGLPIGSNIDYADDLTLIKAFENRTEG